MANEALGEDPEFRDPYYYILLVLTVISLGGAAVALLIWAPWA